MRLSSDPKINLEEKLMDLAIKYNISLNHLYSIIDAWCRGHKAFLTSKLFPTVEMDGFFNFVPREYYFERKIVRMWYWYRKGHPGRKIKPRDPQIYNDLKTTIKTLKRLRLERK